MSLLRHGTFRRLCYFRWIIGITLRYFTLLFFCFLNTLLSYDFFNCLLLRLRAFLSSFRLISFGISLLQHLQEIKESTFLFILIREASTRHETIASEWNRSKCSHRHRNKLPGRSNGANWPQWWSIYRMSNKLVAFALWNRWLDTLHLVMIINLFLILS